MNDQPKPATGADVTEWNMDEDEHAGLPKPTTGEWTANVQEAIDMMNRRCDLALDEDERTEITTILHALINAALAAERRRTEAEMDARHRRQLDEAVKQLADERDKNWRNAYDNLLIDYQQLREQLATAQASETRVTDGLGSHAKISSLEKKGGENKQ